MSSRKRKDFDIALSNDASAADTDGDNSDSQRQGADGEAVIEANTEVLNVSSKSAGKTEDDSDFPSRMKRSKGGHKKTFVSDVPQADATDNDDNQHGMEVPNRIVEKANDPLALGEEDIDTLAQDLPQGPPPGIYNIESFQRLCATIADGLLVHDAPADDGNAHTTPETSAHESDDAPPADSDEGALRVAADGANAADTADGGYNSDMPSNSAAEWAADASGSTPDAVTDQDPLETAVDEQGPVSEGESCSYELSGQGRAAAVRRGARRRSGRHGRGADLHGGGDEAHGVRGDAAWPAAGAQGCYGHVAGGAAGPHGQVRGQDRPRRRVRPRRRGPAPARTGLLHPRVEVRPVRPQRSGRAAPHPPLHTATDKQLLQRFTFEARRQHEVGEAFTHEVTLTQDALQLLESVLPLDGFPEWLPDRLGRVSARLALLQHLDVWMNWELPPIDVELWPASQQTSMLRDFVDLPPRVFWAQVYAATSGSRIGTTDDDNDDDDSKATAQDLDAKFSGLQADAVTA